MINPFPQLGTNSNIDPIGYNKNLEEIKNIVTSNIGFQPLIINVYGDYGQGKTTILDYLKKKFSNDWANLSIFENDISEFPNLEQDLLKYQEIQENNDTDGIFVVLDEMQHVTLSSNETNDINILTNEQARFLNLLRKFSDNKIEGLNNKNFVLCIAMHPGTKAFLGEHGFTDVLQRTETLKIDLKDIDYYMAYMLIKEHLKKINVTYDYFFDESFIYAFYAILPHLDEQRTGQTGRFNGRTYSQLFFKLIEFWRTEEKKLSFQVLKNIMLGKIDIDLSENVNLANIKKYHEIYDTLKDDEKPLWDMFVFNPRWHFNKEFDINSIKPTLHSLLEKNLISERICVILSPDQLLELNNELLADIKTLPKDRIYLNGEKLVIFLDTADDKLKGTLDNQFQINIIYRLNDELLKSLYNFSLSGLDPIIIDYFKKEPHEKVDQFYSILNKMDRGIENSEKKFEKISLEKCKIGLKYEYLNVLYKVKGKIKHRIAIFYYSKDYGSVEFDKYFSDIKSELHNSDFDLSLIYVCPYYIEELPKEKVIIRNMENRMFLHKLSRLELINILKGDNYTIESTLEESIKLYTQESVQKGFTIPLTGFKEKFNLKNKKSNPENNFKEVFLEDIETSWKIELDKRRGELNNKLSKILKLGIDGNGMLEELGKESLSQFMHIDEYGKILGAKFSKYEVNFLELFGSNEVTKDELKIELSKYFSYFSRFDPLIYIPEILKRKKLLKECDTKYYLIQPTDYLNDIFKILNNAEITELLGNDQEIIIKRNINDLKLIVDELDDQNLDLYKKAVYNTELDNIFSILNNLKGNDDNSIEKICEKYQSIEKDLKESFEEINVEDVNIYPFLERMEKQSKINEYYFENPIKFQVINLENINNYLKPLINSNSSQNIDKELLFILESILNKNIIKDLNFVKTDLNDLRIKIELLKKGEINSDKEIELEDWLYNENVQITPFKLKLIDNILSDFDLFIIKPIISSFKRSDGIYADLNNTKILYEDYEISMGKFKDFNRYDKYLNRINRIDIDLENFENHFKYIPNIAKYSIEILEPYLRFLQKNLQKSEIDNLIKIEKEIDLSENKGIIEYIDYISNLDSREYLNFYLKSNYSNKSFSEDELIDIVSKIIETETELSNQDPQEIINQILLPSGLLIRMTLIEEYYDNHEKIEDMNIKYSVKGV
ncbi:hypothetical protein [Methanobacterium alcaliphilum]|uniref:hypothetical protein n=1 Tax=Methanobacterium alcaliphilum TaxID=392018 RepID=UPI00200A8E27|nr:hypothetical protein [Methanobacterium alcaliphilum]MCK9151809.1 hypothetical protein [Methanobacterium alcaliphilum]